MFKEFEFAGKKYEMDEYGNIKKRRGKGFKRCFHDKDGYLKLAVQDEGKRTHNEFIHRLVYKVWNGDIPEGYTVDHDDNDKLNNHKDNLKLLSNKDNVVKGNAKHWTMVSPDGEVVQIYNMNQFCRERGLHAGHMRDVANGKPLYKQHKGWTKHD